MHSMPFSCRLLLFLDTVITMGIGIFSRLLLWTPFPQNIKIGTIHHTSATYSILPSFKHTWCLGLVVPRQGLLSQVWIDCPLGPFSVGTEACSLLLGLSQHQMLKAGAQSKRRTSCRSDPTLHLEAILPSFYDVHWNTAQTNVCAHVSYEMEAPQNEGGFTRFLPFTLLVADGSVS